MEERSDPEQTQVSFDEYNFTYVIVIELRCYNKKACNKTASILFGLVNNGQYNNIFGQYFI